MRRKEIIESLRVDKKKVTAILKDLAKEYPSFQKKYVNGKLRAGTEFNFEETKLIYKRLGRNELELLLLKENWQEVSENDIYTIKGTNKFLTEENCIDKKCCNNCKFLKGKITKAIARPYCSVYEKLLDVAKVKIGKTKSKNINIYEDYCSSYVQKENNEIRRWYKKNAPMNLNQYGKTDSVNGIKRDRLDKKRKRNEPITIVTCLGFD